MKRKIIHLLVKTIGVGSLLSLVMSLAATANAECGGSLNALAASAVSIRSKMRSELVSSFAPKEQIYSPAKDNDDQDSSIVGLWHINFNIMPPGAPGPITIQEAFQIWNTGGTEVHNPNVDPRTGPVCLGAWREDRGTYRLTHRVWSYSPDGVWLGTINLAEAVRVTNRGRNQTGMFSLDFFDPSGNPLEVTGVHPAHIEGLVVGERVAAN